MELQIKGISDVIEWFGEWPSFHDSEIIEMYLNRKSTSWIKIFTWRVTKEVDKKGYFKADKHATIKFLLENITDLELSGFSSQNVVSGCNIEKIKNSYKITLHPCYGLSGSIVAEDIIIEIEKHNLA